ncbi:MAG: ergothioneine biosynthesis protein EgtB [Pseudomonadota bacterium]
MARDLDTFNEDLKDRFCAVRGRSEAFAAPLSAEDMTVQSMCDASPTKWHLAHTTWFWETFLLAPCAPGYQPFDPAFCFLFNSYYEGVGERHSRPERGLLTRPGIARILEYREAVTSAVGEWLETTDAQTVSQARAVIETGIAHEEQHQELLLTDIKHAISRHPFDQAVYPRAAPARRPAPALNWRRFKCGMVELGHEGAQFAFDNEGPRHRALLHPFALASRPVTNGEYAQFIADGGYRTASLWLSDGWSRISEEGRAAPLYWRGSDSGWRERTLHGEIDLDPDAPVSHIDFFEANAFASWADARLPTEFEWEHGAADADPQAVHWAEPGEWLHPTGEDAGCFGGVWEWTRSDYAPYPGYRAPEGAISEYNGKFMCGQYVLRGGSRLTPPGHMRASYRNFMYPGAQWQMSGLRLARDL